MSGNTPPAQLAYESVGDGHAVLLIHGMAGTARSHFGPLIETLRATYRVIAPDLRGYGRSAALPPRPGGRWFATDVDDLAALLNSLGTDLVHLVGYSDGGETALLLAASLGSRVRSATVWGVSGHVPPPSVLALFADPEHRLPNWDTYRADLESLHGPDTAAPMLRSWARAMSDLGQNTDYPGKIISDGEARRILCPVVVAAGDHDPFNPFAATQALVARISTASLVVLPGAGHDLLAERGPYLTALIRQTLERTTA